MPASARQLRRRYRLLFAIGLALAMPFFVVLVWWTVELFLVGPDEPIAIPAGDALPWIFLVALLAFPVILYAAERTRLALSSRPKELLCKRCGYDLRATSSRCPECGAIPGMDAR